MNKYLIIGFPAQICSQDRVGKKMVNSLENTGNNLDNLSSMDQSKELIKQETQKLNKSDHSGQQVQSLTKHGATFSQQNSQGHFEVQTSVQTDQNINSCIQYIDLERDHVDDGNNRSIDSSKGEGLIRKKNKKLNNNDNSGRKVQALAKYDSFPRLNLLDEVKIQAFVQVDKNINSCKDYIDTQCSLQKNSR